jgi:hypothetical protein
MQTAIEAFRGCMSRAEHLGGLYDALSGLTTRAVDVSDLLRAQIVLGVSALDYYVHEVTALGMVAVFEAKRPPTQAFLKYRVSVGAISAGAFTSSSSWFEAEVRERNSYLSFQQPEKITDAVRLFTDVKLWQEVASKMATPEQAVKDHLKLIVDRRNKIAHEADLDPSFPGARWPIHARDVERSLRLLKQVCENIHATII